MAYIGLRVTTKVSGKPGIARQQQKLRLDHVRRSQIARGGDTGPQNAQPIANTARSFQAWSHIGDSFGQHVSCRNIAPARFACGEHRAAHGIASFAGCNGTFRGRPRRRGGGEAGAGANNFTKLG
jgi:hypothetical protein